MFLFSISKGVRTLLTCPLFNQGSLGVKLAHCSSKPFQALCTFQAVEGPHQLKRVVMVCWLAQTLRHCRYLSSSVIKALATFLSFPDEKGFRGFLAWLNSVAAKYLSTLSRFGAEKSAKVECPCRCNAYNAQWWCGKYCRSHDVLFKLPFPFATGVILGYDRNTGT